MKPEKPTSRGPNQGKGDRVSARRHNHEVSEFVAGGKVAPVAPAAPVAPVAHDAEVHGAPQPKQAARAGRRAKRGPSSTRISLDELVAKGRTVVDRVRPIVDRAVGRLRSRFGRK